MVVELFKEKVYGEKLVKKGWKLAVREGKGHVACMMKGKRYCTYDMSVRGHKID